MDEPFGAVDPLGRRALQEEFRRIHARIGTTVMFVTHDIDEAVLLADRIAVFSRGGVVEQVGTPAEVLATPATPFVRSFVGDGRAVRLMSVITLQESDLVPEDPGQDGAAQVPGAPRLSVGVTLDQVFAALAVSPTGRLPVHGADGGADGDVVGVVTPESLHAALRRSVTEPEDG